MIENEFHFLLVSPKYNRLGIKYLPRCNCHWSILSKLNTLMASTYTVNNLSKYLYFAVKEKTSV